MLFIITKRHLFTEKVKHGFTVGSRKSKDCFNIVQAGVVSMSNILFHRVYSPLMDTFVHNSLIWQGFFVSSKEICWNDHIYY